MDGIRVIAAKKDGPYALHLTDRVVYARRQSRDLEMRILTARRRGSPPPMRPPFSRDNMHPEFGGFGPVHQNPAYPERKAPVFVYCPGSGFMGVEGRRDGMLFAELVKKGFVVAEIDYRGAGLDNARFPDAVVDCKAAIRFLRANAEEYGIDPDRIAVGGSSSGAWTAMMAAADCEKGEFDVGENLEYSSRVSAVVDCYGPMDFEHMIEDRLAIGRRVGNIPEEAYSLFRNEPVEKRELLALASPVGYISEESFMPPCLIIHGSEDSTVPYAQSLRIYEKLMSCGKTAGLIRVEGAGHGIYLWSEELMQALCRFLEENV